MQEHEQDYMEDSEDDDQNDHSDHSNNFDGVPHYSIDWVSILSQRAI